MGASALVPPVDGIGLKGVYVMRTPQDAITLRQAVEDGQVKRAVVAGGGFIGLEVAENLQAQGVKVSVIDMASHILPGFDPEIADYVENHLADEGINPFTGMKLEAILGTERVEKVKTDKRAMKADTVVMALGIRPNTGFLKDTGLAMLPNGTLPVNERLQTNDPDIYAVGDCACVTNRITGEAQWSPMGSSANMEGRTAARVIAGEVAAYPGVLGTGVAKLPNLNVGRTGLNEEAARKAGYDAVSVITVVDDKAHYYPQASNFIVKMTADRRTERLLGIQVLGKGAVDKMVDVAATAIALKADLSALENLDLAYAPPFSTAIHPFVHTVNILRNKLRGDLETATPAQLAAGELEGYRLIDASAAPAIQGAEYLDLAKVNGEMPGFDKDEKLLLVCAKGKRAYMLQNRLKYYGYTNTRVLEGGTTFNQVGAED